MKNPREVWNTAFMAFNSKDEKKCRELWAPDVEVTAPGGMTFKGIDQTLEFLRSWWTAFPDMKVTNDRLCIDGQTVVEVGEFMGTHRGVFNTPMGNIQPTNKHVRGKFVQIHEIRNDKIVRQHLTFDRMELMEQLGKIPAGALAH